MNIKREVKNAGRPKKPPRNFIGKNQLKKVLDEKPDLTIMEIAKIFKTEPSTVRRYTFKYGL
jgi:hypothetical protein